MRRVKTDGEAGNSIPYNNPAINTFSQYSKNKSNSEEAKAKAKSKAESKAEAKAEIIKTGNWRDLYDAVGNPLFETSDESSNEDEEKMKQGKQKKLQHVIG